MAAVTWGMLAKSQEDPETIEEAIARLIQEHDDDEDAHLGVGQSLQSHKANEIIDHVVGSVVADKLSKTETIGQSSFDAVGGWAYSGIAPTIKWPGFQIRCGTVLDAETELYVDGSYAYSKDDFDNNFLFQFSAIIGGDNDEEFRAYVGGDFADNASVRFGFRTISDHLWGFIFNGAVETKVDLGVTPRNVRKVYRAFFDKEDVLLKFYIDGVQISALGIPSWSYDNETPPRFYIKNEVEGQDAEIYIFNLTISAEQV